MITKQHAQEGYSTGNNQTDEALYILSETVNRVEKTYNMILNVSVQFPDDPATYMWNGEFLTTL
jgi:hypothetical protein